jgi:hypothetical protein
MNPSSEPLDPDASRAGEIQLHHVVYLVKRQAYKFIFAIPKTPPLFHDGEEAFFQVLFHPHHNTQAVVLKLDELQDFYDSLSQLMEYIQVERQKHLHTP